MDSDEDIAPYEDARENYEKVEAWGIKPNNDQDKEKQAAVKNFLGNR